MVLQHRPNIVVVWWQIQHLKVSCNKEINPNGNGRSGVRSATRDTFLSILESLLRTSDSSSESCFLFLEAVLIANILRLGTLQNFRPTKNREKIAHKLFSGASEASRADSQMMTHRNLKSIYIYVRGRRTF